MTEKMTWVALESNPEVNFFREIEKNKIQFEITTTQFVNFHMLNNLINTYAVFIS